MSSGDRTVTIYHNPKCGSSRNTLALIREAGIEPEVVLYLETPPNKTTLKKLLKDSALSARELVRSKEELFETLGLGSLKVTDEQLIDAMIAHPILINRPLVVTAKGTRLCRPAEQVLELLK